MEICGYRRYAIKFLILSIYLLSFNSWSYGQHILRGVISSDDELEKLIFEVELTDTTFKQLDYLVLDQKKTFEMKVDSSHQIVNVLVSAFGCSPYLQRVDFRNSKTIFLAIELQNCTQQLEEVLVKADQSFVQESGDTLTFDVEGFRVKTDLTLGDILSRMPGIEINVNKQILYQGKRVKQIWVEGRDILNNQHSLAIESLRAEDIETIQIIHEYKPSHLRFSQRHSSDVALNVGLTEAARGKVNGQAEGLFGTNSKYQFSTEAFRARGKSGESAFLRSNNIGTALIQPVEYLGLLPDLSSIGGGKSGELEVVPKGLLPDERAFEETQHLFSASIDQDVKEKVKIKATVIGARKNAREQAEVETTFYDEDATFMGTIRRHTQFPMWLSKLNLEYQGTSRLFLSFSMNTGFNEQRSNNIRSGLHRRVPYLSEFISNERFWYHSPLLTVNMKHKSNWSSGHSTGMNIQNQRYDLAFTEDTTRVPVYGQRLNNYHREVFLSSFFEKKHNDIFLLEIKNYLEFGSFRTGVEFDQLPSFENTANYLYNWQTWSPNIRYGIKTDRLMTHLQLELAESRLGIAGQTFQRTWLNPLFRFKHSWNLTHFIGFSLRQIEAFIDQQNSFDLYQLYDNLQITHFDLEAGKSARTRLGSFYYFNSNRDKKSTINCTINYQETTNAVSRFNRFEADFIISEVFLADKMKKAGFNLYVSRPMAKSKYQWKTNVGAILTSIVRSPLRNIDFRNVSFNTSFSSRWKGDWNMEWKGGYQVSNQIQGAIDQVWHTSTIGAGISYKSKRWSGNMDYDWQLNQVSDTSVPIHILDFSLDYSLSTWLSISLFGRDLLNLNNSRALRFITTPAFLEKVEYNRLEGSLMLGVKSRF